jgi:hypothetical protein
MDHGEFLPAHCTAARLLLEISGLDDGKERRGLFQTFAM